MAAALATPSTVGDIIGFAIRICRQHARMFLRILLVPSIFELFGKVLILYAAQALTASARNNFQVLLQNGTWLVVGAIICAIAEFFLTLRQLALVRFCAGFAQSYDDAYKFVDERRFYILLAIAVTYGLFIFALAFWSVEIGLAAAFVKYKMFAVFAVAAIFFGLVGMIVSSIAVSLPFVVLAPAMACEERNLSTIVGNSLQLAFANVVRTLFFVGVLLICVNAISAVLNAPPLLVTAFDYVRNLMINKTSSGQPFKPVSIYAQIFASIWRSCTNMLISPMAFISCGLYYLDLRMRRDGLDLSIRLQKLESERLPATGPGL